MEINNLLKDMNINSYPNIETHKYKYEDIWVPRVTEILSSMIHEDYLMTWSNNIGLYQNKKYKEVLDYAATIGTYVHNAIENLLQNKVMINIEEDVLPAYKDNVRNAFNAFLEWWNIINKNDYKILMQEYELICPYFGGTLDLLIEINGKVYLTDFKTSNHPSYKYFLQLSAYRYILREYHNINIDGCIILMLNKIKPQFNEIILDFNNIDHFNYMNYCENAFLSLVYSYFNILKCKYNYDKIFKGE